MEKAKKSKKIWKVLAIELTRARGRGGYALGNGNSIPG